MARLGTFLAAVLCGTTLLAGCSGGDDDSAASSAPASSTSSASSATSASSSTSATPTATPSPTGSAGPAASCLFSQAQVSRVLGGSWQRHPQEGKACSYASDRGGVFATNLVDEEIRPGLREARTACVAGVKPIPVGRGFVCVEQTGKGDLVVGNIGARDRLWVVVIAPAPGGDHRAELAAMVALLGTVST